MESPEDKGLSNKNWLKIVLLLVLFSQVHHFSADEFCKITMPLNISQPLHPKPCQHGKTSKPYITRNPISQLRGILPQRFPNNPCPAHAAEQTNLGWAKGAFCKILLNGHTWTAACMASGSSMSDCRIGAQVAF